MEDKKTKVLMYHSIDEHASTEPGAELYCVDAGMFREQMEYLANSYGLGAMGYELKAKKVALTFDDGLLDNYTTAYPVLCELGLNAYFFVLVGKISKAGYMNWQQVRELKDAGMMIGSHGMTHRILTGLSDRDMDYELKESKKILENKLECAVDSISIPRGFHNRKILAKAKEFGYKTIFTSVNRIAVKADWNLEKFVSVLNNGYSLQDKAKEFAKSASKKVLGAKAYDSLRTRILK